MSFYMINLACVAFSAFTAGYFKDNWVVLWANSLACIVNIFVVAMQLP